MAVTVAETVPREPSLSASCAISALTTRAPALVVGKLALDHHRLGQDDQVVREQLDLKPALVRLDRLIHHAVLDPDALLRE